MTPRHDTGSPGRQIAIALLGRLAISGRGPILPRSASGAHRPQCRPLLENPGRRPRRSLVRGSVDPDDTEVTCPFQKTPWSDDLGASQGRRSSPRARRTLDLGLRKPWSGGDVVPGLAGSMPSCGTRPTRSRGSRGAVPAGASTTSAPTRVDPRGYLRRRWTATITIASEGSRPAVNAPFSALANDDPEEWIAGRPLELDFSKRWREAPR